MPRITIYLPEPDHEALKQLALREFRTPREQSVVIILAALEQQGLIESASPNEKQKTDVPYEIN